VPPVGQRPAIEVEQIEDPPVRRRHKYGWKDLDVLVAGVVAADDLAEQLGEPFPQPVRRRLAKENPGVSPAPSVVDRRAKRNGTTANWVREEGARRHAARRWAS
jgi:hypothetical protein